ncbi:MAG: 6-phosphogluconolactonase [Myxococcota bacterium]
MKTFKDTDALVTALADQVVNWIDEAIKERGAAHVVLAGGTTPKALHAVLSERSVPWEQVHVYFGDERCVGPEDPASNYRAAHETLLSKVAIPEEQVHRIRGEDFEAAVGPYGAILPARFDVTLLGMGEDGHTASLFPENEALDAGARVVYVDDSPKDPPERITLSLVALNASYHVAFMVTGAAKADALAEVMKPGAVLLPAARVEPLDGSVEFYVDEAAAAKV